MALLHTRRASWLRRRTLAGLPTAREEPVMGSSSTSDMTRHNRTLLGPPTPGVTRPPLLVCSHQVRQPLLQLLA
jgi:hypothetical protein